MASPSDSILKDRRVLIGLGGLLALGAGLAIAFLLSGHDKGATAAPPASQGGLVVETGRDDDVKLDAKRPLRCFVGGQFVGELTLDECAKRNGVASGSLDVGVDSSGALAAANGSNSNITPLPPQPVTSLAPQPGVSPAPGADAGAAVQAAGAARGALTGACWRRAGGQWQKLPADMTLNACVQALYAGHCERQGGATYGRWVDQTLRSVPGRIEVSGDNHDFRTLAEQGPNCAVSPIG